MGLKALSLICCVLLTFLGCNDTSTSETGRTLRRDGSKDPFPTPADVQSSTALYLRHYTPAQIATLQPAEGLTHLCLNDCNLTSLEPRFIQPSLQHLWLADNHLRTLPEALSRASQLTYLNLDRNHLFQLPDLRPLPLRWLRLNENQLSTWPLLPNSLERIYLAHNCLTEIPSRPTHLREAELSYNPITRLPDDFGVGMTRLDLAHTKLTALPQDLSQWTSIRFLNLTGCPMSNEEKDRIQKSFSPSTTILF